MSRQDDLEQAIAESNNLVREFQSIIREFQIILRESEQPQERARVRRMIAEQRALIEKYQAELDTLTRDAQPGSAAGRETPPQADEETGRHVFISYRHQGQDNDYAHRLAGDLERKGFDVWLDDRIDYGTAWPKVIQEQLDASFAVIVLMTPRSYASNWVQNELAYAANHDKPILPLLLEGDHWFSVAATQCVDVSDATLPPPAFYDRLAELVPPVGKRARALLHSQPFEPEMMLIPAGQFSMGSHPIKDPDAIPDEQPQHRLQLADYYMAKTPVTQAQFEAFVRSTNHWRSWRPPTGKRNHPICGVTWYDALDYCQWLAENTGRPYRLPTEAQWEKAARGTDGRIYPWGDEWDRFKCNTREGWGLGTTPVTHYPLGASPYGLLDMAGNVWEWTTSLWGEETEAEFRYPYNPRDGREHVNASDRVYRVLRGGAFSHRRRRARCAVRSFSHPSVEWPVYGFRVCIGTQSG